MRQSASIAHAASPPADRGQSGCGLVAEEERLTWLVAEGLSKNEIACRLQTTETGVNKLLAGVYHKLGISSEVELILYSYTRDNLQ
jgi:DNA-binding CsgD family transcriptional regulator